MELGPIVDINGDCILHMLHWLRIEDVISFGATNKRFHQLVTEHYAQMIGVTTIKLVFNSKSTPTVLRLFGQLIRDLEMHFDGIPVPNDLFVVPVIMEQVRFCVVVKPINTGIPFVIEEIEVLHWLEIYEQSAINVLNLANVNNLTNLSILRFKLSINLDEFFLSFYNDNYGSFANAVHWFNLKLFTNLRRGKLEEDWNCIFDANRIKFNLDFFLRRI